MTVTEFKDKILSGNNVAIISHQNPDGDAIGSALALKHILSGDGRSVSVIMPNGGSPVLSFLRGYDSIIYFDRDRNLVTDAIAKADVIIFVDLNEPKTRVNEIFKAAEANTRAFKAMIDHHVECCGDGIDFIYSDSHAAATALLVYRLIHETGLAGRIDLDVANAIYVGIMTDTGNFSFGHLTPEIFETAAELIKIGVSPQQANIAIYNRNSEERVRLTGYVMSEKMVILRDLMTAYITISADELRRFRYQEGDTEGLVNIPLSIDGIVNSAMFSEIDGVVRISMRSAPPCGLDMNLLAREMFGGGGHINAAGARSKESMERCVVKFVEGVRKSIKK